MMLGNFGKLEEGVARIKAEQQKTNEAVKQQENETMQEVRGVKNVFYVNILVYRDCLNIYQCLSAKREIGVLAAFVLLHLLVTVFR